MPETQWKTILDPGCSARMRSALREASGTGAALGTRVEVERGEDRAAPFAEDGRVERHAAVEGVLLGVEQIETGLLVVGGGGRGLAAFR